MAQRGVDCVNIADSPLARIRMSAMALAYQIHTHFRGWRSSPLHHPRPEPDGAASDLLGAHALGIRNILCSKATRRASATTHTHTAVFDTARSG